ncbi:MAG: hypothetical protein SGPRY_014654 [Prymnesium sp.]
MRTLAQTSEATQYEEQKLLTRGLHFISVQVGCTTPFPHSLAYTNMHSSFPCVQRGPESDEPDGFWLLKDTEASSKARNAGRSRLS